MPGVNLAVAAPAHANAAAALPSELDSWNVSELNFPEDGSEQDQLAFCLRYAILAPSRYNTQPWRFRIAGDSVRVYADRRRALPIADPTQREAVSQT